VQVYRGVGILEDRRLAEGKPPKVRFFTPEEPRERERQYPKPLSDVPQMEGGQPMKKKKTAERPTRDLPNPGKRYLGVRGKIVDWAEHVFEEGMPYVRVRFTDKTELWWTLQTAHVLREADLADWKTGDFKQPPSSQSRAPARVKPVRFRLICGLRMAMQRLPAIRMQYAFTWTASPQLLAAILVRRSPTDLLRRIRLLSLYRV
jgi:hypothetical protein